MCDDRTLSSRNLQLALDFRKTRALSVIKIVTCRIARRHASCVVVIRTGTFYKYNLAIRGVVNPGKETRLLTEKNPENMARNRGHHARDRFWYCVVVFSYSFWNSLSNSLIIHLHRVNSKFSDPVTNKVCSSGKAYFINSAKWSRSRLIDSVSMFVCAMNDGKLTIASTERSRQSRRPSNRSRVRKTTHQTIAANALPRRSRSSPFLPWSLCAC